MKENQKNLVRNCNCCPSFFAAIRDYDYDDVVVDDYS